MRYLTLFVSLAFLALGMQVDAQYTLTVEEYAVGGVAGTTTYRFYIDMENPDDFLSSAFGNDVNPLMISTDNGFYNDPAATGGSAGGVNPTFLLPPYDTFFPGLGYDSWFTIGIESAPTGSQTAISAVEHNEQPWIGAFDATSALSGQNVAINDSIGGAWYILNGSANGLPDATNQRVLLLQITSDSPPSGTINVQLFPNGDLDQRFGYIFDGPGTYYGTCIPTDDFPCDEIEIFGCTTAEACNFDAAATADDGSCVLADGNCEVCDGAGGVAVQDADGDGVCDGDEIVGCQDSTACNYNAAATDAGTCVYADGNCEVCNAEGGVDVLDADGDGVCDGDEIVGCQDATACNYDAAATDAGPCVYADGNCEVCDGAGGVAVEDADGDGVCDGDEIVGCQDSTACNYNADATNAGTCAYADGNCEVCDGAGGVAVEDADGDGVCDGDEILGCQDGTACNYNADATNAGTCVYADGNCEVCDGNGGVAVQDADGDGVCDGNEIAGCQDSTACNYNAAATDAGSCVYADGNCEVCNGAGGVAVQDADGDGVCDGDEIVGCQDATACNYDATATDTGSCVYADGNCEVCDGNGGVTVQDADGDGVCDGDEIVGCQDATACNYDASATDAGSCVYADGNCEVCNETGGIAVQDADGDGVCDGDEIVGCQDSTACNYNASATDAGSCVYADGNCEVCDGNVGVAVQDADGDGVCDGDEIVGCQDATACNYNAAATDAGSCIYADGNCEVCDGNNGVAVQDADGDGVCDSDEIVGCQDATACNYDASATDAGSCVYADGNCEVCDGNGGVAVQDADGDGVCDNDETSGCTDSSACNYGSFTDSNNSLCVYADGDCEVCSDIGGVVVQDADGDGVCDGDEIAGCQDSTACNYNAAATDAGSCVYADGNCEVCDGNGGVALQDADGDGVCDGDEIVGCQDATACNFDASATDAGSCVYADGNCEVCGGNGGVAVQDADGDGVCDGDEIVGCQDATACNFDASATDASSCVYANGNCEVCDGNGGVALQDADGDGVCDGDEIAGCQDSTACNYNAAATDAGSCVYADGNCEVCDGNGGVALQDADGDGVCDGDEIVGCQDATACNFDASATDAGSCVYADGNCEVCDSNGGVAVQDADGDGVCDGDEIVGCQDATACNYDATATDAGSCVYADGNCEVCDGNGGVAVQDADGDGVCDGDEIVGCQDATACNYDASATDAGSCVYADGNCEVCDGNGGVAVQDADGDGVCDGDEIVGCQDATACNYDGEATDPGACEYPEPGATCSCDIDINNDGICDILGCTISAACNFDPEATVLDADMCEFGPGPGDDCDLEILGCMNSDAVNFNPNANVDDGTCIAIIYGCMIPSACTYNPAATLMDFSMCSWNCTSNAPVAGNNLALGCTDSYACNYDETATENDGSCEYQSCINCMNPFACNFDAEALYPDDSCEFESCTGCTITAACNYDSEATISNNGECEFTTCAGCTIAAACNYDVLATLSDGTCEFTSCIGCTDPTACNYDSNASIPINAYCTYASEYVDCNGDCLNDADGDGVCDEEEIAGCDDPEAINFHPAVTDADNATCVYEEDFTLDACFDFSGDDFVGTADLLIFLQQIGTSCE